MVVLTKFKASLLRCIENNKVSYNQNKRLLGYSKSKFLLTETFRPKAPMATWERHLILRRGSLGISLAAEEVKFLDQGFQWIEEPTILKLNGSLISSLMVAASILTSSTTLLVEVDSSEIVNTTVVINRHMMHY
jgi:hypothetical protein